MKKIFKRLVRIGKAETHSAIDKLEDPIKLTEQGIRELKEDLEESLRGLAEVKAMAIRSRNDHETYVDKSNDYEQKAIMLIKQASAGDIPSDEADRLATESLLRKEENLKMAAAALADKEKFETSAAQMEVNIKTLRSKIAHYENELKTLRARVKVANATKNINKQMANIDSDSTITMLERMKDKVAQEEALAESYGAMADESKTLDDEINKLLGDVNRSKASDELARLKAELNLIGESDTTDNNNDDQK